jgi:hypothetical protein
MKISTPKYTSHVYPRVKNPGPEDQTLISPQRGDVYQSIPDGILEWWGNGMLGMKSG